MSIVVKEVGADSLQSYATIPASFKVESELRVVLVDKGLGGVRFFEEKVTPYMKFDEESCAEPPESWPELLGVDKLGVIMAFKGSKPIGGAAIILDFQPALSTPFDRSKVAALWDIRVHSGERRSGVGSMLLKNAVQWAISKGCKYLRIETQNVNVPACRFYAKNGCTLVAVHRHGYARSKVANESMLIWHLELTNLQALK